MRTVLGLFSVLVLFLFSPSHPFTLSPSTPAPAPPPAQATPRGTSQGVASEWPTYNGDYTGRRYSALEQVNVNTVKALSLAWIYPTGAAAAVKATPLLIDGVLYLSTQDNAYAVEARTGRELWHY